MNKDPGTYLLLRADKHVHQLRNQEFRIAFCFYRMRKGGIFTIYLDFPKTNIPGTPSHPYVLLKMICGVDTDLEKERIQNAIGRSKLYICFAEGNKSDQEFANMWNGGTIKARFDVIVDLPADSRKKLKEEWRFLLDYHHSIPSNRRNFDASVQQLHSENPSTSNPILDKNFTPVPENTGNSKRTDKNPIEPTQKPESEVTSNSMSGRNLLIWTIVGSGCFIIVNIATAGSTLEGIIGGAIGGVVGAAFGLFTNSLR